MPRVHISIPCNGELLLLVLLRRPSQRQLLQNLSGDVVAMTGQKNKHLVSVAINVFKWNEPQMVGALLQSWRWAPSKSLTAGRSAKLWRYGTAIRGVNHFDKKASIGR